MRFSCLAATAALASVVLAASAAQAGLPRDDLAAAKAEVTRIIGEIQQKKLAELKAREEAVKGKQAAGKGPYKSICTASNVAIRKEYGDLTKEERADYVRAVQCLMDLPARTPRDVAPGARSRFDDFTVVHIQQTLSIHYTGNFMAWHRWFIYSYEKALRDECGYKYYQPYWDWAKYADAPQDSPIFNGDSYSLGGNGEWIGEHLGPVVAPPVGVAPPLRIPSGLGGGVVKTGPFANRTIILGPVQSINGSAVGPMGGLGENPRPWKRDVGPGVNLRYANYSTVLNLLRAPDMDAYRNVSEGIRNTDEIGPHGGGHYVIGGDPGGDVFISPADPAFFVHHGQMDRMWTLWQTQNSATRYSDLGSGWYAHQTWLNAPPSDFTNLDEVLHMEYTGGRNITIREVMDTTKGPFCYFYQ